MNSKDKSLIGAIMISTAAFAFFYLVMPSYNQSGELEKAVVERQNLFDSRSKIIDRILKVKNEYASKKESLDKITSTIPSQKNIPELISTLENIAESSGIALISLDIGNVSINETSGIGSIPISLKLVGNYTAYSKLLNLIELNRRLIDIDSSRVTSDESAGVLTLNMSGHVYLLSRLSQLNQVENKITNE